jgi:hypothetical protein
VRRREVRVHEVRGGGGGPLREKGKTAEPKKTATSAFLTFLVLHGRIDALADRCCSKKKKRESKKVRERERSAAVTRQMKSENKKKNKRV